MKLKQIICFEKSKKIHLNEKIDGDYKINIPLQTETLQQKRAVAGTGAYTA